LQKFHRAIGGAIINYYNLIGLRKILSFQRLQTLLQYGQAIIGWDNN
jgi:hypothetical protein